MAEIPDARDLSSEERHLTRWLLEHGTSSAERFLDQVDRIRVVSRCGCGCASINFDLEGRGWKSPGGLEVLSDYQWRDGDGRLFGAFVFAKQGTLAGLEVYSIDGLATPTQLRCSWSESYDDAV